MPATIGVALGMASAAEIASNGQVMGDMAKSAQRGSMTKVLAGFNEVNGNTVFFLVLTSNVPAPATA